MRCCPQQWPAAFSVSAGPPHGVPTYEPQALPCGSPRSLRDIWEAHGGRALAQAGVMESPPQEVTCKLCSEAGAGLVRAKREGL